MNLWDYIQALNKAAANQAAPQPATQAATPRTGAEKSAWSVFVSDLLNLAQAQGWAPAGWVPFILNR